MMNWGQFGRYDPAMLDTAKVKALREKRGLTQEEAARRAGLPGRARWNDIESGRKANVTIQTLDAIAEALGVQPAELLGMRTPRRGDAQTRTGKC